MRRTSYKEEIVVRLKDVFYRARRVAQGLHNFWRMRELIYNYRGWDFSHVLKMTLFFLEDYRENWCHRMTDKLKSQVTLDIYDLRSLLEDDFTRMEDEAHTKKWGKLKMKSVKDGFVVMYRQNARTKQQLEQERKEHMAIYELGGKRMLVCRKRLGQMMRDRLHLYWD